MIFHPNSKLEYWTSGYAMNGLETGNRTDSNFILGKVQCRCITTTRYESKGSGQKFDIDDGEERNGGDRARPLSRLLFCFFFLSFFLLRNNK